MARDSIKPNKIAVSNRLMLSKWFTFPPKFSLNAVISSEGLGNVSAALTHRASQASRRQTNPPGFSFSTVFLWPDIRNPLSLLFDTLHNKPKMACELLNNRQLHPGLEFQARGALLTLVFC